MFCPLPSIQFFLTVTDSAYSTYVAKANQDSRRSKRSTKGKAKAKDDGQTSADDDDEDDDEEEEEDDDDDSTLASSSGNADDDEFLAQVAALKDEKLTKAVRKSQSAAAGIMKMEYQPLRPLIKAFLAARLRKSPLSPPPFSVNNCAPRPCWCLLAVGLVPHVEQDCREHGHSRSRHRGVACWPCLPRADPPQGH